MAKYTEVHWVELVVYVCCIASNTTWAAMEVGELATSIIATGQGLTCLINLVCPDMTPTNHNFLLEFHSNLEC
uniref:Uncharacterized protein n=1 Tax=Setaria italica TaxID=4555 RepID=K3Y0L2_SETIT